ncbi:unnamed protein product [Tilletia controversa]|nr:unnamed protein product [Tilletia controversa]
MADYNNSSYDPYIPSGGAGGAAGSAGAPGAGNSRTAQIQSQIDDTIGVMRDNIAQGFRRGANRVRKQMWWKDMKMRIIIGVGILILICIIVIPIVVKASK